MKKIGVSSIKVDFFGGDGQSMMSYYQDILEDAARYWLMVNCHGSTYPRGWHRTYPNLVSIEGVKRFEYVTFGQINADNQAIHCTILPFTRNLFDPMDFMPVCFSEVPDIKRKTTNSFELVLSVIFLSAIQYYAEIPEGMAKVPVEVKEFMSIVPVDWDESRFIEGYPGKYFVIARRKGNNWYIAGINGDAVARTVEISPSFISNPQLYLLVTNGQDNRTFNIKQGIVSQTNKFVINLKQGDGFVLLISQNPYKK